MTWLGEGWEGKEGERKERGGEGRRREGGEKGKGGGKERFGLWA